MIRSVYTELNGEQEQRMLTKRTWIPVELTVSGPGDYRTFREKLPRNARKVVGAVVTYDAPDHRMDHPRIFVGTGPNNRYDAKFLGSLPGDLIRAGKTGYALTVKSRQYCYYAQPMFLPEPELRLNGQSNVWAEVKTVLIRDLWTDFKLEYRVWKNRYPILGSVQLEVVLSDSLPSEEEEDV
jgi:hypothetical protein